MSNSLGDESTTVRPQAQGIHSLKHLIFFSEKLKRLIEKVWRRGPFSKTGRREKAENEVRSFLGAGWEKEGFDFDKEEAFLDYEAGHGVWLWELGRSWRGDPWQRVKGFFREMSEYQGTRDRVFNRRFEAEILDQV